MDLTAKIIKLMPSNNIIDYIKMGDLAIRNGDKYECLKWYFKGLGVAREQRDKEKVNHISLLIITLI
ncbi:MAG: hypothetical protein ACI8XB_002536 [Patiriisocius sp.]|jgi:hypothetical protein